MIIAITIHISTLPGLLKLILNINDNIHRYFSIYINSIAGVPLLIEIEGLPTGPLMSLLQSRAERKPSLGCIVLFGLLKHEYRLSVLHSSIQRCGDATTSGQNSTGEAMLTMKIDSNGGNNNTDEDEAGTIKSKEPLMFQVGFRRFIAKPVFSEANLNCDKHKFERYLQVNSF